MPHKWKCTGCTDPSMGLKVCVSWWVCNHTVEVDPFKRHPKQSVGNATPPDLQQPPPPWTSQQAPWGYCPPLNVGQYGTKQLTSQQWRSDGSRNSDWLTDPHICLKSVNLVAELTNTNIKSKCNGCLSGVRPLKKIILKVTMAQRDIQWRQKENIG